jgi:hypothetical protein
LARDAIRWSAHTRYWSSQEDDLVRAHYPDHETLRRVLCSRSPDAIRHRAHYLCSVKKRHVWTQVEIAKLRHAYQSHSVVTTSLRSAFPEMTRAQIYSKAAQLGLRPGRRRALKKHSNPVLNAVLKRIYDLNLSLADLDALSRTSKYFASRIWRRKRPNDRALRRAVHALDGDLIVQWRT